MSLNPEHTFEVFEAFVGEEEILGKSLSHFINSFKRQFSECVSCNDELETKSSLIFESPTSRRIFNEICIKSIVPEEKLNGHDIGHLEYNLAIPFCAKCTGLISTLTDLYRQLKSVEEEFNKVRGQFARGVIKSYIESSREDFCRDESNIFSLWQTSMGISPETSYTDAVKETLENIKSSTPSSPEEVHTAEAPDFYSQNDDVYVDLIEIKPEPAEFIENRYNFCEIEDQDDFIIIPDGLDESSSVDEDVPLKIFRPTIKLNRLSKYEGKAGKVLKSLNSNSNNEDSTDQYDSKSDASKTYDNSETEEHESETLLDRVEDQQEGSEDEYVPPSGVNIPKISNGILTRRRAKSLANNEIISTVSSVDNSNINDEDGESENPPTNSSDSESEEEVFVVRSKRKYTRRNTNPACKKKPKLSKNVKLRTGTTNDKQNGNESGPDGTAVVKIKPKRIRKPEPSVQCTVCNKTISKNANLKIHMRIHTGEKPYKCSLCDMSFYKPSNLSAHFPSHSKERPRPYACDVCDARFTNRAVLRCHKSAKHDFKLEQSFECKFCAKLFKVNVSLTDHIRKKHNLNGNDSIPIIRCFYCEVEFENLEALEEHTKMNEHSSLAKMIFEKTRMNPTVKTKSKTRKQKTKEDNEIVGDDETEKPRIPSIRGVPRKCTECGETLPDRRLFLMHKKKFHPTKNFTCEICGKNFSENGNLKKHIAAHDNTVKSFVCDICGETFKHKASLVFHQTKHTGQGVFKCEYCSKGFNEPRSYRRHLTVTHADVHLKEKPFVCKCCYMNFETEPTLLNHMTSLHERLKCKFCGIYFGTTVNHRKHVRIHTGEKPYKCSYCEKTFTQEVNLKEHEYRHTGTRPHRCQYCNAGFLRRKEMQKHIEKHHNEEEIENSSSQDSQEEVNDSNPKLSIGLLQTDPNREEPMVFDDAMDFPNFKLIG